MTAVALLIDADNLSSASDVEGMFRHLDDLGLDVTVRRAYGGLDKITGIKEVLRRFAVRSFLNQGKGTTDVALVVDAMDLLHHGTLPESLAIGSSDADFAPLVMRLREAGLHVICFAREEKSDAQALELAYDAVIYLDSRPKAVPARRVVPAPAARALPVPPAAPAPAPMKRAPAKRAAAAKVSAETILAAVPALRDARPVAMNDVVKQLRDDKLLSKHGRLSTLLRDLPEFRLMPESSPTQVQWTGGRRR
jgi:hypothetical protein